MTAERPVIIADRVVQGEGGRARIDSGFKVMLYDKVIFFCPRSMAVRHIDVSG